MKSFYSVILVMLVVLVIAIAAIFCVPVDAQQAVTKPEWVCVFEIKRAQPLTDPIVRINVVSRGNTEGEAAIAAHQYLLTMFRDESKLVFLEAGLKK